MSVRKQSAAACRESESEGLVGSQGGWKGACVQACTPVRNQVVDIVFVGSQYLKRHVVAPRVRLGHARQVVVEGLRHPVAVARLVFSQLRQYGGAHCLVVARRAKQLIAERAELTRAVAVHLQLAQPVHAQPDEPARVKKWGYGSA